VRRGRSDPTSPTPPLPPRFPPAEIQEGRSGGGEPGSHKHAEGLFAFLKRVCSGSLPRAYLVIALAVRGIGSSRPDEFRNELALVY
jgi:hypothetical protein